MYKIALVPENCWNHETTTYEEVAERLRESVTYHSPNIALERHGDERAIVISAANRGLAEETLDWVMACGILPNWGDWSIKHRFVPEPQ